MSKGTNTILVRGNIMEQYEEEDLSLRLSIRSCPVCKLRRCRRIIIVRIVHNSCELSHTIGLTKKSCNDRQGQPQKQRWMMDATRCTHTSTAVANKFLTQQRQKAIDVNVAIWRWEKIVIFAMLCCCCCCCRCCLRQNFYQQQTAGGWNYVTHSNICAAKAAHENEIDTDPWFSYVNF